jgi:hypothetical protein
MEADLKPGERTLGNQTCRNQKNRFTEHYPRRSGRVPAQDCPDDWDRQYGDHDDP